MKIKSMIWFILCLSTVVLGEDLTFGERMIELGKALVLLTFLTPFGWGAMIIVGFLITTSIQDAAKKAATTDYSTMSEEEKEVSFKQSLRDAYKESKR